MRSAMNVINDAYGALARGDPRALLALVPARIDWLLMGPASCPHGIVCRTPEDVGEYFDDLFSGERITCFEADEFVDMGEQVVVIGYVGSTTKTTDKRFESEWVHIFTVKGPTACWSEFLASAVPTALNPLHLPDTVPCRHKRPT